MQIDVGTLRFFKLDLQASQLVGFGGQRVGLGGKFFLEGLGISFDEGFGLALFLERVLESLDLGGVAVRLALVLRLQVLVRGLPVTVQIDHCIVIYLQLRELLLQRAFFFAIEHIFLLDFDSRRFHTRLGSADLLQLKRHLAH